jgi:peptidoglycan/LPS O-acetylase OafA/YrhL
VVAAHVCAFVMSDESKAGPLNLGLRLFYAMENAGDVAVMVFFVVSGFLVGGQALLRIANGNEFDLSHYSIQRFSRIYTVFVPALLATVALDYVGRQYFNASGLYTSPAGLGAGSLGYAIAGRDDAATLIGNVLMLQTIAVEPYGGNGPLWSLANEWWYYVIFGLFLVSVSKNRAPIYRAAALSAGVIILSVMPDTISWWFSIWLLGVGLAMLDRVWSGIACGRAIGLMLVGFAVALYGMSWVPAFDDRPRSVQLIVRLAVDAVAAVAFAAPLLSAKNASFQLPGKVNRHLAGFSYSLYLVHFPAMVFVGALLHDVFGIGFGLPFSATSMALAIAVVAALCGFAWCFAYVTERNTPTVRSALTRLLARLPSPG